LPICLKRPGPLWVSRPRRSPNKNAKAVRRSGVIALPSDPATILREQVKQF
jgi:hypothetical protein